MRTGFTGHKRLLAIAVATATAAIVGLAGAASAGAAPAATHAAAVSGTQHFQAMTTSSTSTTNDVIAWGVFTAPGIDHVTGNNTDTFVFPGGTFKVTHSNGTGPQKLNPKTCLLQVTLRGTYKLSNGTGKFKGISGTGRYVVSIVGIAAKTKKGACNMNAPFAAWQQVIDASGPVALP